MSGYRLPNPARAAALQFSFDGRPLIGHRGETLAAALLANGERVVARSFKYHRPRGVYGIGLEEPNAIVSIADQPHALATRVALEDGLAARAVNAWPSARFDLRAAHDFFGRLLPAGFYYKTFMAPGRGWHLYEGFIRRAAGLGRLGAATPRWRTEAQHAHGDVLVVGAGPAGIAAALTLARAGCRVILADDGAAPGGSDGNSASVLIDGRDARVWFTAACAELDAMPRVRRLAHTLVTGLYDHGFAIAVARQPRPEIDETLWKLRVRAVVLATGAIERPLIFVDNDRPGVMSLAAVRGYAERHGVACGRNIVVFANNTAAYADAAALKRLGVGVSAIVDPRRSVAGEAVACVSALGIAVIGGHSVISVAGRTVEGASIAPIGNLDAMRALDCDVLAVSGGWTPLVHLHCHAGGRVGHDADCAAFLPIPDARNVWSAGACAGKFDFAAALADGARIGAEAAEALGHSAGPLGIEDVIARDAFALDLEPVFESPRREPGGKAFVDLAADVTADDLRLAAREGYDSVELMKRYTTAGMALDQGRHGNANAIAVLAASRGDVPGAVGTTTYRPPFAPIAFGSIVAREGRRLAPFRTTTLTRWHQAAGAVMYDVGGGWRRPGYYPRAGESLDEAVARECLACRERAVIYDSSPLGKIEIKGRDVVAFLELLYTNRWADLAPGFGRYGLMLLEDGRVFDDGVVFRLAPDHFLIHTTTGNAEAALQRLDYHRQMVWPELDVRFLPVTTQWADIVLCGPRAREILTAIGTDIDLAREAFPFMALRNGLVGGVPARVMRVSFTGELSFEIHVAARQAEALWCKLLEAEPSQGVAPLGSEANHVLRIEKGFISVGHEADGIADPFDLGMKWIVAMEKPDFIGKRSLLRNQRDAAPRPQLVGLLAPDPSIVLPEGAQILDASGARGRGYVTASCMSPTLKRSIALALIEDGRKLIDGEVRLFTPGGERMTARVTRPVFLDPRGERMRG